MKVMVVSPHPDDETLGAGGTILRMMAEGHEVYWLNVTAILNEAQFSKGIIEKRRKQLEEIEDFYHFSGVYHLNMPTTELESVDSGEAIGKIGAIFREVKPELIILPDYNDAHSDHKRVFEWCYACSKVFRFPFIKQVMTMEIISETDFGSPSDPFKPNYYVDITDYMDGKIKAMEIYDTELGESPFPRSIENIKAMAMLNGARGGVKYAEAFRLIKCIV